MRMLNNPWIKRAAIAAVVSTVTLSFGCGKKSGGEKGVTETIKSGEKKTIQNIGSDTMVNLAQAWAEEYAKIDPSVSVEVSGGGSGIGIAALINGTADVANASRRLEPEEIKRAKAQTGDKPREYMVAYDAISIFVHKDNPLNEISVDELAEIYKETGKITKWSQLGVTQLPGAKGDDIIRVNRQNNSGTYHYFREAVLGHNSDFKSGSLDMNGSKDVIDLVAKTPNAIAYAGLGYATEAVKVLKVSKKKGEPAIMPSIATTLDKSYPIARPMFMYTPGEPPEHVKKYLDWIHADAGQRVVEISGYIPLPSR
ncbi:MAG: phosphate ABC transporter substrate-binding protein [Deltaproteobacteria bacterium]|nr:phosphate ABC transporter substrate-binding protein [Deltaproteobacteria bacterium]